MIQSTRITTCFFLLSQCIAFALTADSAFLHRCDSLFILDAPQQITSVTSIRQKHTVFQSITVKTIDAPHSLFQSRMKRWLDYVSSIRYVKRIVPIDVDPVNSLPRTVFIELGVFIAVSWMMGDMSFKYTEDSTDMYIYLKQNNLQPYYSELKDESRGAIRVEYHDFLIWYRIKDIGNGRTRISLNALIEPKIWIPGWLFKATSKTVFPGMLKKIEDMVIKKQ